jgi:hypothetical protein
VEKCILNVYNGRTVRTVMDTSIFVELTTVHTSPDSSSNSEGDDVTAVSQYSRSIPLHTSTMMATM